MSDGLDGPFLLPGDPAPVEIVNPGAKSGIVIACDHAGRSFPQRLSLQGLSEADRLRHIAWDIGARDIAHRLAERLDAALVCGAYSRLVVDLNRYLWDPASMAAKSDGTEIGFNRNISSPERQARIEAIFFPYHAALAAQLDRVSGEGRRPVFVSAHTMTDRLGGGQPRAEEFAVLSCERDTALSRPMIDWLRKKGGMEVGDNTPYSLDIGIDFTVPEHGLRRKIPSFMFEVRQDLVATPADAAARADVLADGLEAVLPGLRAGR